MDWWAHLEKIFPGLAGSAGAMMWLQGTWRRKFGLFAFGVLLAWYIPAWLSRETGIPEGVAGLMVGLFGMAIIDKMFSFWFEFDITSILKDWIRKKLGIER